MAVLSLFFFFAFLLNPQITYAQYNDINFGGSGVSISYYPSGSDGSDQDDIILYENVATINSQSVDCYVIVDSVTGNAITNIDQNSASGSSWSNNSSRFFSTFTDMPSTGGQVHLNFQFIQDGTFSYNSSSNVVSATNVTLDSVRVNSYDLDGNGSANSEQYTEFENFTSSELDASTNLSFSSTGSLTRWTSTTTANTSNITDPTNRVRVFYNTISDFQVVVGSGNGAAYFFVEFAAGFNFGTPQTFYQINGNLFNDSNGLFGNSIVDGLGTNVMDGTSMYASLINSGDSVIESIAIASNGSYSFPVVADGSYSVITTTSQLTTNSTGNSSDIPSLWKNTGENIGTSAGNDGTPNGEIAVTVNGANVENVNFGVNKRPEATTIINQIDAPAVGDSLTVGATTLAFGGFGLEPSGTDNEDGAISNPDSILITSLPKSTNKLTYDGTEIVFGADATNPPSVSNPFSISSFDNTKLKFVVNTRDSAEFNYSIVDAAGLTDQTPATFTYFWTPPIPVEFIGMNATLLKNEDVLVSWSTAMELNNHFFEVQRADIDNSVDFKVVGIVEGAGTTNSIQEYSFSDNLKNANSDKFVYRIRQVDFDGKFDYSRIASITRLPQQSIIMYPTPANNVINIDIKDKYTIELSTLDGRVLQRKDLANGGKTQLSTDNLNNGMYIATVYLKHTVVTKKVLVRH